MHVLEEGSAVELVALGFPAWPAPLWAAVLLAPLVAVGLVSVAWHYNVRAPA